MVVKLGTLILEASVFQQSPRFLLLQLGLADRHEQDSRVGHQLLDGVEPGLVGVNIVLSALALENSHQLIDLT